MYWIMYEHFGCSTWNKYFLYFAHKMYFTTALANVEELCKMNNSKLYLCIFSIKNESLDVAKSDERKLNKWAYKLIDKKVPFLPKLTTKLTFTKPKKSSSFFQILLLEFHLVILLIPQLMVSLVSYLSSSEIDCPSRTTGKLS